MLNCSLDTLAILARADRHRRRPPSPAGASSAQPPEVTSQPGPQARPRVRTRPGAPTATREEKRRNGTTPCSARYGGCNRARRTKTRNGRNDAPVLCDGGVVRFLVGAAHGGWPLSGDAINCHLDRSTGWERGGLDRTSSLWRNVNSHAYLWHTLFCSSTNFMGYFGRDCAQSMRIITLPWSEIEDFVPGSFALRINTTNGKHVGVWAVQRANAAKPGRSVVDLLAIKLREVKVSCKFRLDWEINEPCQATVARSCHHYLLLGGRFCVSRKSLTSSGVMVDRH